MGNAEIVMRIKESRVVVYKKNELSLLSFLVLQYTIGKRKLIGFCFFFFLELKMLTH